MSKNKYTNSALKEATNIVEKCIRRKTKKTKKLFFLIPTAIIILVTFLFILPYIF